MTRDLSVWTAPDCALVLICLTFAAVQGVKDGFDVVYVTDPAGRRSQTAHRTGIERLAASAHGGH
jgi:hypothetical protein